ncbi:hypothetical protein MMC13_007065 [Lambiella insularis]|nr:hypothetical protein [Lambiella insularis]
MSRRADPATGRAGQNQQTIKSLLKLEGNKSCADCKRNKHPRWASWNLGVFVCIRCSGIHRGMGTHISRVKSVDLDAWTDEQLQSVLKWGNARANKYWEAKLAPGHVPSEAKIENFIRTKYESKRWVMEGPMPDPSTLDAEGDDDVPLNVVQEKAKLDRASSQRISSAPSQPAPPPAKKPAQTAQIFDLMGGDDMPTPPARPSTTDTPTTRPPPAKSTAPSSLLGGLDFFGEPPNRPASASAQPAGSTGMSRPDLKQSILSLYASAPKAQPPPQPSPQSQPPPQHGRQASFGGMQSATTGNSSAFGGLDDAFSGLNFGNSNSPSAPPPQFGQISAPKLNPALAQMNAPTPQQQPKPPLYPNFGQISAPKSNPAPPLSGGGFFDTVPKPPPKQATSKAAAPPALAPRKFSNASSGFGEFSSALNPMSGSSIATSTNGLLDLSSPPMVQSARPANPSKASKTMASVFNLSAPAPPSNYQPMTQSSAPPTKSTFSGMSNADPWGSSDPWANSEPAVMTPQAQSIKSPAASSATASDFGWGNTGTTPAQSAGLGAGGGTGFGGHFPAGSGGFGVQSPPVTRGFGSTGRSPPKITAEEDFGGWNTAAPETPAVPNPPSISPPKVESHGQQRQASFTAPQEDLFSNVWG